MDKNNLGRLPEGVLSILDRARPHVPYTETDVRKTWEKHGWSPRESRAKEAVNTADRKRNTKR